MGSVTFPIRVLYIMGYGRSGSTVIGSVLGNHSDIVSVGELMNLSRSGWINAQYCACGERGNVCPFWSGVRREWIKRTGVDDIEGYMELQSAFERLNQWLWLSKEKLKQTPRFRAYGKHTYALFKALSTVSGKSIIVDSSKSPARAFSLSLIPGIDLQVIHLIRDSRGVAWSLKKEYQKDEKAGIQRNFKSRPICRTAISWLAFNLQSNWVRRQLDPGKSMLVRYEDFMSNPETTLNKIGELTEIDLAEVSSRVLHGESISVGHNIAGNRLRMAGEVQLQPDIEWKHRLPSKSKKIIWIFTGWLMRRYGYKKSLGFTNMQREEITDY
jgi:hypothetical protein